MGDMGRRGWREDEGVKAMGGRRTGRGGEVKELSLTVLLTDDAQLYSHCLIIFSPQGAPTGIVIFAIVSARCTESGKK